MPDPERPVAAALTPVPKRSVTPRARRRCRPSGQLRTAYSAHVSIFDRLAAAIDELHPNRRVLIAFDGPDAVGKSTLSRTIKHRLRRPVLAVSIDDWHNPRQVRHRRGRESSEGYYHDCFDYAALRHQLLDPFRADAPVVRVKHFDYNADRPDQRTEEAASTAALLFDGVFLLRPELRHFWDLTVHLHAPASVTLTRALARDADPSSQGDLRGRYEHRYFPGQALYRAAASPLDTADIVIDNSNYHEPVILRWMAIRQP